MCVSPLAFLPGGFIEFVFPKLLLVSLALVFGASGRSGSGLPRSVTWTLVACGLLFVVACLLSATPVASLVGRWPRYEGVVVVGLYAGSMWLGARVLGAGEQETRAPLFVRATAAMSTVLFVASAAEQLGLSLTGASDVSRPGALLGNATDQGLIAMLAVAVLVRPALAPGAWWVRVGVVSGIGTVALSGSRTALLATAAAIAVHIALSGSRRRALTTGAVVIVGVGAAVLAWSGRLADTSTVEGRWLLWKQAWELATGEPAHGIGPSRFVDAVGSVEGVDWVAQVGVANPPDSPHNVTLQVLLAGGVPLFGAACALVGAVAIAGYRGVRSQPEPINVGLAAATVGYVLAMLANFTTPGTTCFAAFLAGAVIAQRRPDRVGSRTVDLMVVGIAGVTAVVMAASCGAELALQRGVTAAVSGDVAAANSAFDRARWLRPFDGDVCMIAAQSLAAPASSGNPAAAAATLHWARCSADRTPNTRATGVATAVALNATGRSPTALPLLDRLAVDFPMAPDVFIQRAVARAQTGDLEGARRDAEHAHWLDPQNPVPVRLLGQLR